jgi:predicted SnoaL-like aldol condensation-catalyzing enzyme
MFPFHIIGAAFFARQKSKKKRKTKKVVAVITPGSLITLAQLFLIAGANQKDDIF